METGRKQLSKKTPSCECVTANLVQICEALLKLSPITFVFKAKIGKRYPI
jgi:hypothetical protein